MKTKIIVGAIAIVSSMALGAGSMFAVGQIVKGNSIGEENARNFAYVDAGVQPEGTIVDRTEFTMEKGIFVYDVGFRTNDTHYAYLIDSMSGTIIEKEIETVSGGSKSPDVDLAEGVQQEKIGVDKAKQTALLKAGVASGDAVFSKANLEYDNGKQIYDIEFIVAGDAKYDYEIDAYTGEILEESSEKITGSQMNQQNEYPQGTGALLEKIGVDKAKQTALSKAGVASGDAVFSKANLEYDNGKQIYDIEFIVVGKAKYDYEIDAYTGEILEESSEIITGSQMNRQNEYPQGTGAQQEKIGVDKAKQIALSKAGVASGDAVFSKANLEYDNGKQIYDIEFIVVGKAKYEYEIDAVAGNVLEENIEKISISNQNNTTSAHTGVISIEEAKSTALRKAGLSSKDVVFSKAKLDRDDGMLIYEIDFYVLGKTEYEYEIDAVTGEILEQDIEPWEWDD